MSSHWYEAVIEKFGTVDNFVDQLYEKQFGGSMLNYKDVVVAENRHKVFVCELKNSGEFVRLTVAEGTKEKWSFFNNSDYEDLKEYSECDIEAILEEYEPPELSDYEDDQDYFDGEEYGIKIDNETLKPFTTPSSNVYKYNSLDELDIIIKALDEPIVDGLGCSWEEDYKKGLDKCYGLVFFWTEYDDFSCGNPYTLYCKIIDGGSISG